MRSASGIAFTATATPQFLEFGGKYGILYYATWSSGTVTLKKQGADGNYHPVATAFSADGYIALDLPTGNYEIVIATSTGVNVELDRIPGE